MTRSDKLKRENNGLTDFGLYTVTKYLNYHTMCVINNIKPLLYGVRLSEEVKEK